MPVRYDATHMSSQITFDDGAGYEDYMGVWSRSVGEAFLDWLAPAPGVRWLDVGCGNGAFTELIAQRCAPSGLCGIDPSAPQLAYAHTRPLLQGADLRRGDAMALPFGDDTVDAAVMPLVIFFVPDPARGVAEMARVVAPGGIVTAYAWDMAGGGFPYAALLSELRAMGVDVPTPPSADASRVDVLRNLWTGAGLGGVETREIAVQRTFASFDDYWLTVRKGPSVGKPLTLLGPDASGQLLERMRSRLPADAAGRITIDARANAVRGRVLA
jgi:SAM-dependent methyltransferase